MGKKDKEAVYVRQSATSALRFLDLQTRGAAKGMAAKEYGRSMVEMLGVLAIIGVLSAGALAGFNKAMLQHKLNKHIDEIGYLLSTAILNQDKLKDAHFGMINELKALGAFTWPIEAYTPIWPGQGYPAVNDSLGNQIWFENYTTEEYPSVGDEIDLGVYLPQSDFTNKICYNYINVFKNFADEIEGIYVRRSIEGEASKRKIYLGKNCVAGSCLSKMTNNDIIDLCQNHCPPSAKRCILYAIISSSRVEELLINATDVD